MLATANRGKKKWRIQKSSGLNHTFNPWIGCQHVSPGCDHCYAETQNAFRKWNGGTWGPHAPRKRTSVGYSKNPIKWNAAARAFKRQHRHRPRVFCASLADAFDNQVQPEWRQDLFALIRECYKLDWLVLTKRPQNITKMLPSDWGRGYQNVWLGVTAENQTYFDQRWKILQDVPAWIKFISYEPALGPLRLPKHNFLPVWLISGGESGPGARPLDPQWVRDVIADCRRSGIAPFHKQWGIYASNPLVVEKGMSTEDAEALDNHGKGGVCWMEN
jgi:protein gp37